MMKLDTKKKYGVKNFFSMLFYLAALSGVVYVTYELLKKLEQCNRQTDMIMLHMLRLKSCFEWGADVGMIVTAYGITLLFDVMISACATRYAIQKKRSMVAIIGGGIIVVIAKIAINYITRLGF